MKAVCSDPKEIAASVLSDVSVAELKSHFSESGFWSIPNTKEVMPDEVDTAGEIA